MDSVTRALDARGVYVEKEEYLYMIGMECKPNLNGLNGWFYCNCFDQLHEGDGKGMGLF